VASDQGLCAESGEKWLREGLAWSPKYRVCHTSLSVFPPPGTGQVFRPHVGRPDKSSAAVLSEERRKRHGQTPRTTARKEGRHAGGSPRGLPRALRGAQPQREDFGVVRRPHAPVRRMVRRAGDRGPLRPSLLRPRAVRAALPSPGLRAQHRPRLRPSPEDPMPAGPPGGLHPRGHHHNLRAASGAQDDRADLLRQATPGIAGGPGPADLGGYSAIERFSSSYSIP
jgi:hypothetical protein